MNRGGSRYSWCHTACGPGCTCKQGADRLQTDPVAPCPAQVATALLLAAVPLYPQELLAVQIDLVACLAYRMAGFVAAAAVSPATTRAIFAALFRCRAWGGASGVVQYSSCRQELLMGWAAWLASNACRLLAWVPLLHAGSTFGSAAPRWCGCATQWWHARCWQPQTARCVLVCGCAVLESGH